MYKVVKLVIDFTIKLEYFYFWDIGIHISAANMLTESPF